MKRGHALLALALAAAPAPARAQTIDRSNGEAGAPLLQLTTTPRAAAVGLALGIRYLDLGSVDEVVCNACGGRGTPTGQRLSANEQAFALAGAVELGRASVGAALNYYATTLAEASGGAASFSAGVRGRLSSKLVLGASVQYLGGQVDVGGFGAPLPRTVRAGAELRPLGPGHERVHLLLAADYAAVRGAPGRVGGGIEAGVADPATQLLAVARLGYLSRAGGDFDQRPLTLGLGLRFHQVSLDYAYQGSEVLSSQHRLGLTFTGR